MIRIIILTLLLSACHHGMNQKHIHGNQCCCADDKEERKHINHDAGRYQYKHYLHYGDHVYPNAKCKWNIKKWKETHTW